LMTTTRKFCRAVASSRSSTFSPTLRSPSKGSSTGLPGGGFANEPVSIPMSVVCSACNWIQWFQIMYLACQERRCQNDSSVPSSMTICPCRLP
jgi:hypothetical protein